MSAATSVEQTAWEATGPPGRSELAADKNVRAPALAAFCSQLTNHLDYCSATMPLTERGGYARARLQAGDLFALNPDLGSNAVGKLGHR